MKVAITAKRVVILMMTMALAVVFVACQAAAPKPADPEPGPAGPAGEPAPKLPYLDTPFEDVELAVTGEMAATSIPLAGHFVDPHGETLEYTAGSSNDEVVTVSVSGSTLALKAEGEGEATVTVRAENKDGVSAFNQGARFTVTVMETVPPMVADGGIPDQNLYIDDDPLEILLTKADAAAEEGYFFHEKEITYVVTTRPIDIVDVAEADGTLTLTPVVPLPTTVTVVATADGKSTDSITFAVDVMAGSKPVAPVAEGSIDDIVLTAGASSEPIDVADKFSDADSDTLTYDVSSSMEAYATASVSGSKVTVTAVAEGMATITVTATDDDGLMADQMFDVTVEAAEKPDKPDKPDKPENVAPVASAIPAVTMTTEDDPLEKDLSMYFSDADDDVLTFDNPVSSDPTVATVTSEGSTLTITAVGAGTSNLSLTATDPGDLFATASLMLTVSEPAIPGSFNLSVGGTVAPTTRELELPDGYTLQTADSSKVNVVRTGATGKGNEWRLTARSKTTKPSSVTVYVNDENNTESSRIEVTVLNSPPVRNKSEPSLALLDLNMVDIMDADGDNSEQGLTSYGDGARYDPPITSRVLYRTQLLTTANTNGIGDLSRFYTDADGDPLSFEIEVVAPHVGLILFKTNDKGFLYTITRGADIVPLTQHVVYADILTERIDRPIGINIYANDGEAKSEGSVPFELRNEKPIPRNEEQGDGTGTVAGNQAYLLTQLQEPGFFRNESYGNRTGVDHIFKFGHATKMVGSDPVLGFTFAHDFLEKLKEDGFMLGADTLVAADHLYGVGNSAVADGGVTYEKPENDPTDLGTIYYEATVSGPITQKDELVIANFVQGSAETTGTDTVIALSNTVGSETYPEIKFRFNSVGTGSLNITFGVWADPDAVGTGKSPGWQTETRQIDFRIIGCESVARIADCP